jgi:hypothetical protein
MEFFQEISHNSGFVTICCKSGLWLGMDTAYVDRVHTTRSSMMVKLRVDGRSRIVFGLGLER